MIEQKRKQENPMPVVDEGWWSSVLAEEGRFSTHPPAHSVGNKLEVDGESKSSPGKVEGTVPADKKAHRQLGSDQGSVYA